MIESAAAIAAISPQSLLPDLTTWADATKGFMYDWTVQGSLLRLTSAVANIGTGPLELRGGATHGDTQDVYQRIFEPDGTYTDVLAGTFTYHPEHGHIHFDGFAEFRLREFLPGGGVGAIVASGDKVSFCLLDVERYDATGPASPFYLTCGQVQGISVGWADVYDRGLPGQSIDITNVPDGTYWLEAIADPDNLLLESDETNNATRIQINLQRGGGGGPILPDAFESNNSFAAASILAPPEDHVYENLTIHSSSDVDFYRVTASASGTMTFRLAFQHAQGDIDMEVFNAAQTRIGISQSVSNSEQFSFSAVAGQYYFVRVYGYQGATTPIYSLTVDQPGAPTGTPDQFEQNDSFVAARALNPVDQTYINLSIDAPNDDDYYSIVPAASGTMTVSLAFQHTQGDIDVRIYNASQTQIGLADSATNNEQLSVAVTAGQTYYIRVYGYQGAINPNYAMTIDVPTPTGITPDQFEQNDSFAAARALTSASQVYTGLTIDAANDDDYYSIVPTASGTLSVGLAFQHAQGDIDLRVYGASQTQLGVSESVTNSEQVSTAVVTGQTYYIRVHGYQGATNPNYTMTLNVPTAPPPTTSDVYYLSTTESGSLASTTGAPLLSFTDADILKLSVQSNGQYLYELHFDGSDVGLTTAGEDIDAFTFLPDGSIVISTVGSYSVPAPSGGTLSGTGADLLRFVPTSLGATTAGSWSMYFDGSDVGLDVTNENIDAVAVLANGTLLISTIGPVSANGVSAEDEDLLLFTPTSLGANTAGSWSLYFDGSDVGLATNANEDVNALYVRETSGNPTLLFSTLGDFSVTGAAGANEDVFAFTPTALGANTAGTFGPGLAFDGSIFGLAAFNLDGVQFTTQQSQTVGGAPAAIASAGRLASPAASATAQLASTSRAAQSSSAIAIQAAPKRLPLDAVRSQTAPISPAATTPRCGCGASGSAASPVDSSLSSNNLTIWDHISESLDELLLSALAG